MSTGHLLKPASPADFLILPPSVSRSREAGSKVLKCLTCEAEFGIDQQVKWARHVRNCSERNAEQMEAVVAHHQENELATPSDPEVYKHIREGGN